VADACSTVQYIEHLSDAVTQNNTHTQRRHHHHHTGEPCNNGRTGRDAIGRREGGGVDSRGPVNHVPSLIMYM